MLDPQDRTVLLEALEPPTGYTFDEGIGTTYTLDLISLLSVPLAFTKFDWDDAQGQPTSNPTLLMEALRRHIGRLTIFCQAGRTSIPKPPNALFTYLEDSVVDVTTGRLLGIFHPKIWALRYLNETTAEVRYRLLSLSRNLTNDRCWDLSLALEGPVVERKNAYATNHPLARFFEALPGLAVRQVSDVVRQRAQRIGAELRRVDFAGNLPAPFEEIAFHPIGIEGHRRSPLPDDWNRGLIISPFIDEKQARDLSDGPEESVLVSRQEELDKLPKEALAEFKEVLIVAPNAEGELEPDQDDSSDHPRGLHAKLYVCENGWNSHLFVGSANATTAAFKENIEFLVELVGKRSKVGIDQFLQPGEGQAALRNLLVPYQPPSQPVLEDPLKCRLEKDLDLVRNVMASAGWRLSAQGPAAGPWRLSLLRAEGPPLQLPETVRIRVWPVTLPETAGARPITAETREIQFAEVSTANLTSFLACHAEAKIGDLTDDARFVLNLPLEGTPSGRREAILRLILDDPQKVLRFLQFLLDDGTSQSLELNVPSPVLAGEANRYRPQGFVLLESLLRTLANAPKRLDEVEAVLRELGSDADAHTRLPTGLLEVWPAIWAARGMIPV
jgi:hypothetical protein